MKKNLVILALAALSFAANAQVVADQTSRLVIKFKPSSKVQVQAVDLKAQLGTRLSSNLKFVKSTHSGAAVYDIGKSVSIQDARDIAKRLSSDTRVQSVEPDLRVFPKFVPTDPYYSESQWSLKAPAGSITGGMNAPALWARSLGNGVTVAVLDTGMLPHSELNGRIIQGYDFVSDPDISGDLDGRDADPTDPGDFCLGDYNEVLQKSTWHGTAVAGVIAAAADSTGMVGVAPQSKVLNVRVLGRCGGWLSDVADGIAWASGQAVNSVPAHNLGPMVLNLSLGSTVGEACPQFLQSVITPAIMRGSILVAATGNEGAKGMSAPANCQGVISVAGHTGNGDLAAYSNYSSEATISGPSGGACKSVTAGCYSYPALTLGVKGDTVFERFTQPVYFAGTSAATPFVAAALALAKSIEPSLDAAMAKSLLQSTSREFPVGTFCHANADCGFGMLDASALLAAVDSYYLPTLTVAASAKKVTPGTVVTLTASASSRITGTSYTYSWSQKLGAPVVLSVSGDTASFTAPSSAGSVVVEVSVADSGGRVAKSQTTVQVDTGSSAPVVTLMDRSTGAPGATWTLQPVVTDAENNVDRLVVVKGPQGLVANGMTLTWPTPVAGNHEVVFIAVDKTGLESEPVTMTLSIGTPDATGTPNSSAPAKSGGGGGGSWGLLGGMLLGVAVALKRKAEKSET